MDANWRGYGLPNISSKQDEVRGKRGLFNHGVFQSSQECCIKDCILHQMFSLLYAF